MPFKMKPKKSDDKHKGIGPSSNLMKEMSETKNKKTLFGKKIVKK